MRAGSNERGTCARRGASASCLVSARTVNLQGVMRRELRLDAGETAYAQVTPAAGHGRNCAHAKRRARADSTS